MSRVSKATKARKNTNTPQTKKDLFGSSKPFSLKNLRDESDRSALEENTAESTATEEDVDELAKKVKKGIAKWHDERLKKVA